MKKLFLLLAVIIATSISVMAQSRTVTGVVIDADTDEPLVGASVLPVGSSNGVATDVDGRFTLSVPGNATQLTVSYVGYTPATVAITPNMTVALKPSSTLLDQVVVTGYGSGKKLGSVVGSVSVVGEAVLENTPAATFIDALQGQVPGLSIYSNSGDPSSNRNSVYLRGINSLTASNTPLYILDGAPVSSSVFTTINPSDIKNVTVLKDASSTAIYGARAANGVIVITTKKGSFGEKANVTIRANYGFSQMVGDHVEMMNSEQYIKYRDMIGVPVTDEVKNLVKEYGISTNWRDQLFKDAAPTYSIEGAVSGGSDNLSYFLALSHYDQDGIIESSGMRRETVRWSLDTKVNDWFRIGFQGNLGYTKYKNNQQVEDMYNEDTEKGIPVNNPMILARMALPYDAANYYTFEDGKIVWGDRADFLHYTRYTTPTFLYKSTHAYKNKVTINANIYEQITPIKGLTLRAQQSVDALDYRWDRRVYPFESFYTPMNDPVGSKDPSTGLYEGYINVGAVQQNFERYYQFTYTNTAEYRFNVQNLHNATILLGQESIIERDHSFRAFDSGHNDRRLMLLGQGLQSTYSMGESMERVVFNSLFANLNYDFDNRYFLDFSFRRDGSSKFAPAHRWANFVAFGLMWNVTGEKFLESQTWLDDLKLRFSYGSTGNSGIPSYMFQGKVLQGGEYAGAPSITVSTTSPGNPDLTWETVKTLDVGVTFGIFDRLTGTVDFYNKNTDNMLLEIPYSITTGVSLAYGNIGSMRNRGFEVELRGDIYKSKDWYVGARVGFAYNKNEITALFDGRDFYDIPKYGLRYEVGHDAREFYSVRYAGVDPRDGKQMWYDKNGNKTKTWSDEDKVMTGKSYMAPWTGGFGFNFRWKEISLSTDFAWAADKYMMNNDKYFVRNGYFASSFNQCVDMLNTWTTPGQVTDIPAYGETIQYVGDDTSFLEDASFLRMKNLTLSYSLPSKLTDRWGMKGIMFHFTGRNLLTITDFSGYDPEPQSNYVQFQYPNTRQYEFGVEVSF